MIQGIKTAKEYYATPTDSSSSLKLFAQDRRKYKKKYIDNERAEEEDSQSKASITGSLVDCLLLEKDKFDSKFALSSIQKAPSGKMLDFCNALVTLSLNYTDESGNITKSFEEMANEARTIAQFEWKLTTILEKFVGQNPEVYYKEAREIKAKGLTIITLDDISNAERVVEDLKTNEFTAPIINLVDSDRYKIYKQLQIEDYEIDGLKLKSMMDFCVIDSKKKTIQCYDLKCTFSVEGFFWEYYLKRLSYIQAYLYKEACLELKNRLSLEYYTVLNPAFLVVDSIGYMNPLIYTLDSDDLSDAYDGFFHNNRKYIGVREIILELKWAKSMNRWNISKKNYENNGIKNLKN